MTNQKDPVATLKDWWVRRPEDWGSAELREAIARVAEDLRVGRLEFGAISPVLVTQRALATVLAAAEAWAKLQWRPGAEAEVGEVVLVQARGNRFITHGVRLGVPDVRWFVAGKETSDENVLGWLPLDALGGE